MLYQYTQQHSYRAAAFAANRYVRRTMKTQGVPETLGGIKGSFPVSGDYGQYQYLNWAAKFFVDSNMMEREVRLDRDQSLEPTKAVEGRASITRVNC
jgi:hypothetical protein